MLNKYYTEEELNKTSVGELRQIAKKAEIPYYTTLKKSSLILKILEKEIELVELGDLKAPEGEFIQKKEKNILSLKETLKNQPQNGQNEQSNKVSETKKANPNKNNDNNEKETKKNVEVLIKEENNPKQKEDKKPSIKYINKDTGEVFDILPDKAKIFSSDKDQITFILKNETEIEKEAKSEQLSLELDKPKKDTETTVSTSDYIPDEDRIASRQEALNRYRLENGYVPENTQKQRKEIGGNLLTKILIVMVPIVSLFGIYSGIEVISAICSKLWYGDLAYIPNNIKTKAIIFIIFIITIVVAKYTQKFDKVIDYYSQLLKSKSNSDSEKE